MDDLVRRTGVPGPAPRTGLRGLARRPGVRDLVRRIEAATPRDRDRAVDALRAFAILGVVCGHWLVTALVADSGTVHGASPLQHMPGLAPVSWMFQTLAVFFLVGGRVGARGYASARARGESYGSWLGARMVRLFRPVAVVTAVWGVAACVMLASGVDEGTVRALGKLVWSPLWFLLVFAALTAATPLVAGLHPLWPLAVVLYVDLFRLGFDGPAALGWINVAAALAGPLLPGGGLGAGRAERPPDRLGAAARRRDGRGGARPVRLLPRVHGRRAGRHPLQPRPADARRRRLRPRPVRSGPAPARTAAAGPRAAAWCGPRWPC